MYSTIGRFKIAPENPLVTSKNLRLLNAERATCYQMASVKALLIFADQYQAYIWDEIGSLTRREFRDLRGGMAILRAQITVITRLIKNKDRDSSLSELLESVDDILLQGADHPFLPQALDLSECSTGIEVIRVAVSTVVQEFCEIDTQGLVLEVGRMRQ